MSDKKDVLKECIAREFEEIAREEEEFLEKDTSLVVPEGTKEAVLARVKEQIRAYQEEQAEKEAREKEDAIDHLSEEDRKALELGRKMLKAEAGRGESDDGKGNTEKPKEKKTRRRKKPVKVYLALAAVIVCVLAMGITSMGGPERIVRMVRQDVGDRDVEKSSRSHKVKTINNEEEEEAYQEIRDVFDTDVVKVASNLKGMKYDLMKLDESSQIAEIYYTYKGKTIAYIVNAPYRENSWGVDFEDPIETEYTKKISECEINVTLYKMESKENVGCSAEFKYNNIEYLLTGTMKRSEFEKILNNLVFPL